MNWRRMYLFDDGQTTLRTTSTPTSNRFLVVSLALFDNYLIMRVLSLLPQAVLLLSAAQSGWAASSWSFTDASVNVAGKGAGVGGGFKEK